MSIQDCQGLGISANISLPVMVAYCSVALDKPVLPQMCVLGSMSIGGTINRVEELASTLQVAFDAGAKSDPEDAAESFRALVLSKINAGKGQH